MPAARRAAVEAAAAAWRMRAGVIAGQRSFWWAPRRRCGPVRVGDAAHLQRFVLRARPVVQAGQQVAVHVDQGNHPSRASSRSGQCLGNSVGLDAVRGVHPRLRRIGVVVLGVAVAVAVAVLPEPPCRFGPVDDHAQDFAPSVPRISLARSAAGPAVLGHADRQDHAVHARGHHARVGHRQQRRRVDEHEVVLLAQQVQQLLEARRGEQLGRVGRQRAARQDRQAGDAARLDGVGRLGLAGDDRRQPDRGRQAEQIVWRCGLRRSASISRTRLPDWAMETARLAASVLLPSPVFGLVTWMTLCPSPWVLKYRAVRTPRYASASADFGR